MSHIESERTYTVLDNCGRVTQRGYPKEGNWGDCPNWAIAYQKCFGGEIYGVFLGDEMEHCIIKKGEKFIDSGGVFDTFNDLFDRYHLPDETFEDCPYVVHGIYHRPVTRAEVRRNFPISHERIAHLIELFKGRE
jgi:hypothetical protein